MKDSYQLMQIIEEPAPKVRLMYQAVVELLMEHREAASIKVSDITSRAGIGKGTAYEYFSTKDEIITRAVVYECQWRLTSLEEELDHIPDFRDKIYGIYDWIRENCQYYLMIANLLQMGPGKDEVCSSIQQQVPGLSIKELKRYAFHGIDNLMNQGWEQRVFQEQDLVKRRLAFLSSIVSYLTTLMAPAHGSDYFRMEDRKAQDFAYEMLEKLL